MGLRSKFGFGLKKTRDKMSKDMQNMLDSFDSFDEDLYSELEEILVMSDVGVQTALDIVAELRERVRKEKIKKPDEVKNEIREIVAEMLEGGEDMGLITVPSVLLVIGVNGAGKTTTIGKLAAMYKNQGKQVILGAADTFRAAAIDQLSVWADRAGVDIVKHKEGTDPAAVIFDTIQAGKARDMDIIICDTAGRLHNKKHLMDELAKMFKIIDRELPYSDREILLVLDATTGQNAVNQARDFMKTAEITGIVLTKLDSTAKGGVVLSIKNELKIPVKFIGVGEQIDDLQPFNPKVFAESLFFPIDDNVQEDEGYYEKLKEDAAPPEQSADGFDRQELADALEAMFEVVEEAESSSEEETEAEAEVEVEEKQEFVPDSLAEELEQEPQGSEVEPEVEAESETEPEIEPEIEAELETEPEIEPEIEAELETELEIEPEIEPEAEPEEKKKRGFFGGLFGRK